MNVNGNGIVWTNIFYRLEGVVRIELFATEKLCIASRKRWEEQMEIAGGGEHTCELDEDMQQEILDNEYQSLVTTTMIVNRDEYSEFGLNMIENATKRP